jgi:aldehyde:ferredoxin oxidoreductase
MASKYGGYTGQGMRVNLTTGKVTLEDTIERYLDYVGGTGLGYKVIWDEVPPGTDPLSPENKLVFAGGPLSGTGALCSGRAAITSIMPLVWPKPLIASAHMGGNFAPMLKYAGLDYLILEGKAPRPVYLHIFNKKARLVDAGHLWGQGVRRASNAISQEIGPNNCIAAIGPAGENLVTMSVVVNSVSHIGGAGTGAIMGSKNLKAIALQGDLPVRIAGDKSKWEDLINYHRSIIGANNQHVVPSFPSPLFEYSNPGSRWVGAPGKRWGAAEPPVELTSDVLNLNRIAYRTNNAVYFLGNELWKYTVRTNGCHACPVRCYTLIKDKETSARYGIKEVLQNTCVGVFYGRNWFPKLENQRASLPGVREACMIAMDLMDDLGVWCNYGQLQRDFLKLHKDGYFEKKLGGDEFKSIPWDKLENSDPSFLQDIIPRIAYRTGDFGDAMGMGSGYTLAHWNIPESDWLEDHYPVYWKMGHPKHHANEDDGQCGVVINTQYNRDAMCHSHCNFVRSGLPIHEQKNLAEHFWGSADAVDAVGSYTPTNRHKMIRAKWSIDRKELHDMLGLCNWMGPWISTPIQKDRYIGDNALESKLYSLATGHELDTEELDKCATRAFTLHRAITMRDMGELNVREKHDTVPDWVFHDTQTPDRPVYTKGTIHMDREDISKSLDLFYEIMDWDGATGAPKPSAYQNLGMKDVADAMRQRNLLPG